MSPIGGYDGDDTFIKGGTDNTPIGNTGDRLRVDSRITSLPNQISAKLRFDAVVADTTVTSAAFVTLYSYNGSGLFFGLQLVSDHIDMIVQLTIDGNVIFSVSVASILSAFTYFSGAAGQAQEMFTVSGDGKVVDFSPNFPIPYSSNVKLEVKSRAANHKAKGHFVWLTKET